MRVPAAAASSSDSLPPVGALGRGSLVGMLACAVLAAPAPAWGLSCGSKSQPVCAETAPPGQVLQPPPGGNPYGLQPLSTPLSGSQPLWPRVRGHKPYGFNAASAGRNYTTFADEALLTRQMGGSIARLGVSWGGIQHYPNSGQGKPWNYGAYLDTEYLAMIKQGIRPLLFITKTPRRFTRHNTAAAGTNVPGCGTSDECWNPPRSDASGRLGIFARDLATRYPLAAGIELWNEPNIANPFWGTDAPNPEYYASLLNIAHDAVKSVNQRMPVLGGALASTGRDGTLNGYGLLSLRTFLRRMLTAGAQPNMDGFTHHPYLGPYPSNYSGQAAQNQELLRRIQASHVLIEEAYAAAALPIDERIVWTEAGASTTDGWTPEKQSAWVSYHYSLADTNNSLLPLASRTDAAMFHETVEWLAPPAPRFKGYGFVRVKNSNGFPTKPVYCAFRMQFGGFADCPAHMPDSG